MWTEADEKQLKDLQQRKRTWEEQRYDKLLEFINSKESGLEMLDQNEAITVVAALRNNLKAWKLFLREKV